MTLYLKYRPQKLSELDITSVRQSLSKLIESGNIPHAFLFAGPKGTGKTSAARIIAKVVNCNNRKKANNEPCNKCEHCKSIKEGENIDVIEMDAASHRGIDDVRSLKDAVKLVPASAKKKVYIIDEAHMLTKEASNALLKTLEEPPNHVMFILATTNPEKLIDTIRSRTTIINFRRATEDEIIRSLKRVVKGEKIKVEKGSLRAIAKVSTGSFRDAVKLLEQLVSEGRNVTVENVEEIAMEKGAFNIDKFLKALEEKNSKDALAQIESVVVKGGSIQTVLEVILQRLRSALLAKVGVEGENLKSIGRSEVVELIELFSRASANMRSAYIEQLPIEIAIVKWCLKKKKDNGSNALVDEEDTASPDKREDEKVEAKKTNGDLKKRKTQPEGKLDTKKLEFTQEYWVQVLSKVKPENTSTEALLRAARPISYDGETLTLGVYYSFHKEKLETNHHRMLLESVIQEVVGNPVRVVCELTKQPKQTKQKKKKNVVLTQSEDEDIIKIAEEIFE